MGGSRFRGIAAGPDVEVRSHAGRVRANADHDFAERDQVSLIGSVTIVDG